MRDDAAKLGSQKALAATIGVHPTYISDIFMGRRVPGPKILAHYGLKRALVPAEQSA